MLKKPLEGLAFMGHYRAPLQNGILSSHKYLKFEDIKIFLRRCCWQCQNSKRKIHAVPSKSMSFSFGRATEINPLSKDEGLREGSLGLKLAWY